MKENLMNQEHKTSNPASRKNYDIIFGQRCHFHTFRRAVQKSEGIYLCESCIGEMLKIKQSGILG